MWRMRDDFIRLRVHGVEVAMPSRRSMCGSVVVRRVDVGGKENRDIYLTK